VFPDRGEVESSDVPSRKISIPVTFKDVSEYKRIFNVALKGLCSIYRVISYCVCTIYNVRYLMII